MEKKGRVEEWHDKGVSRGSEEKEGEEELRRKDERKRVKVKE